MAEWFASLKEEFILNFNQWFTSLKEEFILNFIKEDRWKYLVNGLSVTLQITLVAVVLGIVIGVVVAIVRSTYDKNYDRMHKGFGRALLRIFNAIANVYLTVVRGTPVVVQLLIIYYIIFAASNLSLIHI